MAQALALRRLMRSPRTMASAWRVREAGPSDLHAHAPGSDKCMRAMRG